MEEKFDGCSILAIIVTIALLFAAAALMIQWENKKSLEADLEMYKSHYDNLSDKYNTLVEEKVDAQSRARQAEQKIERFKKERDMCRDRYRSCYADRDDMRMELRQERAYNNDTILERVMYQAANVREYEADVYDCTEFSRDLSSRLQKMGWDANTEAVRVDCSTEGWGETCEDSQGRHMIVRLDELYLEATSGQIIRPDQYDAYGIR